MGTGIRIEYQKVGVDGKPVTEGIVIQADNIKHHELHANGTGSVIHLRDGRYYDLPHADFHKISKQIELVKGKPNNG